MKTMNKKLIGFPALLLFAAMLVPQIHPSLDSFLIEDAYAQFKKKKKPGKEKAAKPSKAEKKLAKEARKTNEKQAKTARKELKAAEKQLSSANKTKSKAADERQLAHEALIVQRSKLLAEIRKARGTPTRQVQQMSRDFNANLEAYRVGPQQRHRDARAASQVSENRVLATRSTFNSTIQNSFAPQVDRANRNRALISQNRVRTTETYGNLPNFSAARSRPQIRRTAPQQYQSLPRAQRLSPVSNYSSVTTSSPNYSDVNNL